MLNGMKKNRAREKPTKRESPIIQGIVKTQQEEVEVGNISLCNHRCSLYYSIAVECSSLKYIKNIGLYNQSN